MSMQQDIQKTIDFILELEKLKGVSRSIKPLGQSRYENSAEHSWQIALFALIMKPYANAKKLNIEKVLKMLLIHDIVEIDAGDANVYDKAAREQKHKLEIAAAKRLFSMLPKPTGPQYQTLWDEFETGQTPEAEYARGMDRVLPILQNLSNKGGSWVEHNICKEQVLETNSEVDKACSTLWELVKKQLDHAQDQGFLR